MYSYLDHILITSPSKCVLGATSLNFLGFHVDSQGICPMEDKVQPILDFPLPLTQCKLREFVGLVTFITVLCLAVRRPCSPCMIS